MYVRTFGQYQSDAAARRAAQELFTKYESDCRGIDLVKPLRRREEPSLVNEARLLQRRIAELPQLFRDKAELDRRNQLWLSQKWKARTPTMFEEGLFRKLLLMPVTESYRKELASLLVKLRYSPEVLPPLFHRKELVTLLAKLGFPPDYIIRDLNWELRKARCEQRINSLRWSGPCGGAEVIDPENISRQVADHYVQTELGTSLNNQKTTCSVFGRTGFCDLLYPQGIKIRVNFSKAPYTLTAVQVSPKLGPMREYSYWCLGRKVNLR